jgi:hypothetical protein
VHTGELAGPARWWYAVFETGGGAALGGVTALQYAGLQCTFDEPIHVVVAKSSNHRRPRGVVVHETRRLLRDDVLTNGPRRLRPEVAAVLGALWARSLRQAALILIMTVNQRLTTVEQINESGAGSADTAGEARSPPYWQTWLTACVPWANSTSLDCVVGTGCPNRSGRSSGGDRTAGSTWTCAGNFGHLWWRSTALRTTPGGVDPGRAAAELGDPRQ